MSDTYGWLYCLSNPSMPGIYKVGSTETSVKKRILQLYKTGVPTPFVVELAKKIKEYKKKERVIHKILDVQRVNPKREFFKIEVEQIKLLFELLDGDIYNEATDIITDSVFEEEEHL